MTPKEKAAELVEKFRVGYIIACKMNNRNMYINEAKQCALIAADELIELYEFSFPSRGFKISYWDEVKQEIEKL